ncbi:MAG TPA: rhomboid family intramembrane serine protease [Aggregatilinea sp.]|uniref:rhomboid family intramembrane serine protease n=1 Tax=Aggregatilinea sp. TaxID=2806333 RepID=UPI002D072544|nr:rhomboid family intramembrane serine protease [Aggregatilinea sp.]HML24827.1 rhomboid family intramembrane serine protease [Aggregatilinea sp.]
MSQYQNPPTPDHDQPSPQRQVPQPPPGFRRVAVRLPVSAPRVTYVLLAVIVLIYLYYMSLSSAMAQNEFLANWAKINDRIRDGEYYRLLTSMFLHLNLMHIVFNGYALYIIGRDVEALFGHVRFALIYFLGGLSGSLASFVFTSAPSVGASGAIFAVFGAEAVYFYQHRRLHGEMGRRHLNQLIVLMVVNLALGVLSQATTYKIDNAGHIGGLIGGVVLAWFIGPHYDVQADPAAEGGHRVVDLNPVQRWALPSLIYAVTLAAVMAYAVAA